jgi:hypothetical protein
VKVGDLIQFSETGYLGSILEVSKNFGEYAEIWVHGDVNFKNPTHMNMDTLQRTSEVVSETR